MKKEKGGDLLSCCKPGKEYKGSNPLMGIAYGIIPHIGCILFVVAAILGATVLMQFFRPFLMNRYIFHYLILISVGFATVSSYFYLRKNKALSWEGIKGKKGYLSIMYGSVVGINIVLFFFVFPFLANVGSVSAEDVASSSVLSISVDIPCPGHAPLISSEVKTVEGVEGSKFSFPNDFDVYYDPAVTSEEEILSLEVFDEYPAIVLNGDGSVKEVRPVVSSGGGCRGGCGGAGSCGGSCGSPTCSYNK